MRRLLRLVLHSALLAVAAYYLACAALLVLLRFVDPPTTGVQIQRRVESWFEDGAYHKDYRPLPLERISPHVPHAVVAAEDTRFYEHAGIDWKAIRAAQEDNERRKRARGGSTIPQQLVKNLFMTTHRSIVRKAAEVPLTYLADWILPKERLLELYVNVVEWGDGIYGIEAAAQHHYGVSAERLSREQAARLAACLPSPRRRVPQRMDRYGAIVLERMEQQGR